MSTPTSYEIDAEYKDAPWIISKTLDLRINRQAISRSDKARSSAFDKMGKVSSVNQVNNSSAAGKGSVHWLVEVFDTELDALLTYEIAWSKYTFVKIAGVDNLLAHVSTSEREATKKKGGVAFLGEFCVFVLRCSSPLSLKLHISNICLSRCQ